MSLSLESAASDIDPRPAAVYVDEPLTAERIAWHAREIRRFCRLLDPIEAELLALRACGVGRRTSRELLGLEREQARHVWRKAKVKLRRGVV